jgi:predicted alpha/beta-fold hydrolase
MNYRGLAGAKLYTPVMFCSNSYQDALEPMKYIHHKYERKKMFAVGCSMGGNILANVLGYEGENSFIKAACVVQAPVKQWECQYSIENSLFGLYNLALGKNIFDIYLENEPVLKTYVK